VLPTAIGLPPWGVQGPPLCETAGGNADVREALRDWLRQIMSALDNNLELKSQALGRGGCLLGHVYLISGP